CGVGCHGVYQEPRPFAGGRSGQGVSSAGGGASPRAGMGLGRAFHGRRKLAGSVGQREEFSTQEQEEFASAGRSGKCDRGLSRRETLERNARIEKRSGCTAGAEGRRQGGQVELQRESVGGESQRVDCVEPLCLSVDFKYYNTERGEFNLQFIAIQFCF